MNGTERAWADVLAARQLAGEIRWWGWEPVKLILAEKTTYTIDFLVLANDGIVEGHEIKGYARDDWAVKFKVARRLHPWVGRWVVVKRENGQWKTTTLGAETPTAALERLLTDVGATLTTEDRT